jgi:hypothetical protein
VGSNPAVRLRPLFFYDVLDCPLSVKAFYIYLEFEALTVVAMKNSIFWDGTPCNPLKVNRRFGGTCYHLEDGDDMFLRNVDPRR